MPSRATSRWRGSSTPCKISRQTRIRRRRSPRRGRPEAEWTGRSRRRRRTENLPCRRPPELSSPRRSRAMPRFARRWIVRAEAGDATGGRRGSRRSERAAQSPRPERASTRRGSGFSGPRRRRRRSSSFAPPEVPGQLAVSDREVALRQVGELITRLGAVENRRVDGSDGPILELTMPARGVRRVHTRARASRSMAAEPGSRRRSRLRSASFCESPADPPSPRPAPELPPVAPV